MTRQVWINLPVKDVSKTKDFFSKLGFTYNLQFSSDQSASFLIGNINVMFFADPIFKGFTQHAITDTTQSAEVLFSMDAGSKEEVDEMAKKAESAGGIVFGKPSVHQGWMYGCAFTDLDGHRWNVLYMDISKMPK